MPPLATGSAVPEYPSVNVPDDVTGVPLTDKKPGADNPTDVTVPEPPPETVAQDVLVPSVVRYLPLLPD